MSDKTKKIVFVGLNDTNLGDPVIQDCTEWLFMKYCTSKILPARLYLNYVEKKKTSYITYRYKSKVNRLFRHDLFNLNKDVYQRNKKYFEKPIKDADLVVVVGGGLVKYSYQYFYSALSALLYTAEKHNTPVVLNAVGVEGYSTTNPKCQMLKKALHLPALVYMSTRDDIDTLINGYFDGKADRPILSVADPAVWAADVYGITKDETSDIIGVGIARDRLFIDNGIDLQPETLLKLYVEIVENLLEKGHEVRLFTNGLHSDNMFAIKVCNTLVEKGKVVGCVFPTTPCELVRMLASFKAVIATRLHSCIISYSLDVPAVGLVWNDKLSLWGKNIKKPDCFISPTNFNAEYIVSCLYQSMEKGYDNSHKKEFRNTIAESVIQVNSSVFQTSKNQHVKNGGVNTTCLYINNFNEIHKQ